MPKLPKTLEEWTIEILNELIEYRDIESETFDFKGTKLHRLYDDICAMANTNGGFIVLGIDEVKSKDSKELLRFRKIGFKKGQEDFVSREVGNSIVNIDPQPNVKLIHLNEGKKFCTVLKVEHEIIRKPYFVKGSGQCYVRIGNSSRPASRSTVLNLFTNITERRSSVERLRVTSILLKESLLHVESDVKFVGRDWTPIAPLDLTFIRNAAISCEWFLIENNLFGGHKGQGVETGLHYVLHNLDLLNTYIVGYNQSRESEREHLAALLRNQFNSNGRMSINFLDNLVKVINDFLAK